MSLLHALLAMSHPARGAFYFGSMDKEGVHGCDLGEGNYWGMEKHVHLCHVSQALCLQYGPLGSVLHVWHVCDWQNPVTGPGGWSRALPMEDPEPEELNGSKSSSSSLALSLPRITKEKNSKPQGAREGQAGGQFSAAFYSGS